jgi:hypothetical protein
VGFVVDKVALGQIFSEYVGFPYQSSFHQFLHNHHHISSGAGTTGQWPQREETLSHPTKNKEKEYTQATQILLKLREQKMKRGLEQLHNFLQFILPWIHSNHYIFGRDN